MTTFLFRVRVFQRSGLLLLASAAVVVALVGASSATAQSPPRDADLRILVVDLAAELRLVYRNNVPEFTHRHEQLRDAITAWNASSKSASDRQQMTAWLREAIHNSMPGAEKPMPAVPTFVVHPTDAPAPQRSIVAEKPIVPSQPVENPATREVVPTLKSTPVERSAHTIDGLNWAEHPAASDLPAELRDSDPFRDDPPAATTQP